MGSACAGQNKAKLVFSTISKAEIFDNDEKLGALNPIGSKVEIT